METSSQRKPSEQQGPAVPEELAPASSAEPRAIDRSRYTAAAALLREWMADETDYDERTWPQVDAALKTEPLRIGEGDAG